MAKQQRTWGIFIIQLALAIYFVVTALCLFGIGSSISSEEVKALTSLFGSAAKVINIILGILLIVCGFCFCIKAIGIDLAKFDDFIKYTTLVLWIIITVAALIFYRTDFSSGNWLHWFLSLAKNALIIGGILTIKNGK